MALHHLPQFISLLQVPDWQVKWGYNGNLYPFMFLRSALIPVIPHRMTYFFWFTMLARVSKFKSFYLAFSTLLALTPQAREIAWGYSQLPSIPIPTEHSEMRTVTSWSHRETDFELRHYHWPPCALVEPWWRFWTLYQSPLRPCIKQPLKYLSIILLSPLNTCYLGNGHSYPRKRTKRITI